MRKKRTLLIYLFLLNMSLHSMQQALYKESQCSGQMYFEIEKGDIVVQREKWGSQYVKYVVLKKGTIASFIESERNNGRDSVFVIGNFLSLFDEAQDRKISKIINMDIPNTKHITYTFKTMDGGMIVRDIVGSVFLITENGDINLSFFQAGAVCKTKFGNMTAFMSPKSKVFIGESVTGGITIHATQGKGSVKAKTQSGPIRLNISEAYKALVTAKTVSGQLKNKTSFCLQNSETQEVQDDEKKSYLIELTSDSGDVTIVGDTTKIDCPT